LSALSNERADNGKENASILQNQSTGFDFERKTEGTDMEHSRLLETGNAKWSEFRLTRYTGLAGPLAGPASRAYLVLCIYI
jgi:hypothetical protein